MRTMAGLPETVIAAATSAIRTAFPGEFAKPGMPEPDALARAALEAAAPLLADKIASAILRYADENEPEPGAAGYLSWHRHLEAASAVAAKTFGRDHLEVPPEVEEKPRPAGAVLGPLGMRRTDRRAMATTCIEEVTGQDAAVISTAVLTIGGTGVGIAEEFITRRFAEALTGGVPL